MADLLGTDEFLVNRNDVTYTQEQETLMATLQDTDHLLINRAGQTYKITGEDLINSVVDPLEVTVILAPTIGYTDTEVTAVPVVSGGKQPDGGYIFTYQWVTANDAAGTNKANIAGAGAPGGGGGAGDGLIQIDNGDNTFNLAVKAYPGYGIAVESEGVRIGDDWSAIPTLV